MPDEEKIHTLRVSERINNYGKSLFEWYGINNINNENLDDFSAYTRVGDRFGKNSFCKVEIVINDYYEIDKSTNDKLFQSCFTYLEKVCEVYNYFIDIYASVTRHKQISKLSIRDIHHFKIFHAQEYEVLTCIEIAAFHHLTAYDKNYVNSAGNELNTEIQKELFNNNELRMLKNFGIDAIRQLFSGNYLLGIVVSIIQLEGMLHNLFFIAYKKMGMTSEKQINNEIDSCGVRLMLDNLSNTIRNDIYQKDILPFLDDVILANKIRNKYVHKGKNPYMIKTFDQAEKLINIVNKFCHVLENIITNNTDAILPTKIIKKQGSPK
ncbi:hypothetical protein DER53_11090 [Parageobacillus toebii NBRC 107807]|uniref:Uncharacterized protein n=1 Tax=Parageobacillus toebii NBRC 107807 TaxID=1223503 RepID=A0A6G9J3G1_9BACL|nr:hypothetical protein [Parageobacillus toebii]MBB3870305.1 hypothetical protein [Parageobacillus toebii NBRC 107807]QIQ33268.1 hypothetical protein DER53_11090 [Parageobacillus toebii NBRC 107807]